MSDPRFGHEQLRGWVRALLEELQVRPAHAASTAEVLLRADLQGIDTHGVARLPAYVGMLRRGAIAVDAEPAVVAAHGATALVDANNVLGHPASEFAMAEAITRAAEFGIGWVAVRNSNHHGIAGHYARQAAEAGFVGLSGTNAGARVAAAGARSPYLGTNPLACAVPTTRPPMFVFDMATSAVSTGKLEHARREGQPIPEGWGVDARGEPTRDPGDLALGGWLLPLGSFPSLSSHKGYGLGLMVEILAAMLAGGPPGPEVHNMVYSDVAGPSRVSHFFGAIDPGAFGDRQTFAASVTAMLADLRALPPDDPSRPVMTPGEPEWRAECERRASGIPLRPPVVRALQELGRAHGHDLPAAGR